MSNSLRPHEPQYARPPCPSPTTGVYPDSCPLSWWCHLTISSSVIPFSSCPQSVPASESSNESTLHMRWPKYLNFSFSISPSNESGLISFRIDWFDLLVVQVTLKSLLQHHSSKGSILRCSAFFTAYWPFINPLSRNIHSYPLYISQLYCFSLSLSISLFY